MTDGVGPMRTGKSMGMVRCQVSGVGYEDGDKYGMLVTMGR